MAALEKLNFTDGNLLDKISNDIFIQGYSISPQAFPRELSLALYQQIRETEFEMAGIGRQDDHSLNQFVRKDSIHWIEGKTFVESEWNHWCSNLMNHLNRQLFLGLFSFESHFAKYEVGDFYKRHYDAFRGEKNRILSMVLYLNPTWDIEDKGELALFMDDTDTVGLKVIPQFGTLVFFLSEEFPHEVLATQKERYSIAAWFRVQQENPLHNALIEL